VRRGVVLSLETGVAQAYLELRELDHELEISNHTVDSFQQMYELFTRQYKGGVASKLDSLRAEGALAQAASTVPVVEAQIRAKENELAVLLGRAPGPIPRGPSLLDVTIPPEIPAGVPSLLLERRPDLIEAEQNLIAANAQIGVTFAQFFPRIGLTALWGSVSEDLSDFLKTGTGAWSRAALAAGPLFTFGRSTSRACSARSATCRTRSPRGRRSPCSARPSNGRWLRCRSRWSSPRSATWGVSRRISTCSPRSSSSSPRRSRSRNPSATSGS